MQFASEKQFCKLVLINKIAHLQIEQAYRDYQKQQREMRAAEAKLQTKQKEVNENSEHLKALEQKSQMWDWPLKT